MSSDVRNFALIGAAGYIAPRHMAAIKATGNRIVAAMDPNDSVGIIDSHFPESAFFVEFERFDRHIDKLRRKDDGRKVEFVSICSPNYLHDSHIRFALRAGADAICEKPLVVNPWNAEALQDIERESGHKVHTILQLRLHPSIIALRQRVADAVAADPNAMFDIDLTYITSRGAWYFASWKGEDTKSGGIAANIGVHFFDMLLWVFGPAIENNVHLLTWDVGSGVIRFKNANVRWFLSVNAEYLPEAVQAKGQRTYRSITMDGGEIEFSEGFTDLHTDSYRHILNGGGFGLDDALPAIRLVHEIRTAPQLKFASSTHPLAGIARRAAG
ncbi:Gfo/Idh/MocA family protein [Sphingomonas sp. LM7]|uniref:Gfo/Idh/MocA family protein n=1 Tax=Sphingomonas sp. LM7 TaxID=1938607 RepID=UPI000983C22B|nr:Gfo/Idh/MocA family oxidoreductase [Sphingomonas sp. LM7]AQR75545.1 oxidoreductase [Sphingomonas sp. LM7]